MGKWSNGGNGKWRWANKVAPEPDNECSPLPFPF